MKKLITLLIALLLTFVWTMHHYHTQWHKSRQKQTGDVCTVKGAMVVWHTRSPKKKWSSFQHTTLGKTLGSLHSAAPLGRWLKRVQLLLDPGSVLSDAPLTVSACRTSENSDRVGWMFSIEAPEDVLKTLYKNAWTNIEPLSYCTLSQEKLGPKTLLQLTEKQNGELSTVYALCEESRCTLSTRKDLLQQVCQHGWASLRQPYSADLDVSDDSSYVYVDFSQCAPMLEHIFSSKTDRAILERFCKELKKAKLHCHFTDHSLLCYGTSRAACASLASTVAQENSSSESTALMKYAPRDSVWVQHFSFEKADQFLQRTPLFRTSACQADKSQRHILRERMGGEVLLSKIQKDTSVSFHICCIQTFDPKEFAQALGVHPSAIQVLPLEQATSLATYEIEDVGRGALQWISDLIPGFEARHLICMEDCVVIAEEASALRTWSSQIQAKRCWKTSSKMHKALLEDTLLRASYSLFLNPSYVCGKWADWVDPGSRNLLTQAAEAFGDNTALSIQLTPTQSNKTLVSLLLAQGTPEHVGPPLESPVLPPALVQHDKCFYRARAYCKTAPWPVKTHRSQHPYLFLQDEAHCLYFLDNQGNCLWQKVLAGPLIGAPLVMDFYKNGKVQYGLSDGKQLYLLDYYGRNVEGYPQAAPSSTNHLGLVDYRNDKQYRILMSTSLGDVYLQDQNGQKLPGWSPKKCGSSFVSPLFHIYTGLKDYFVGVQTDGTLQRFNRMGALCSSFAPRAKYTAVGYDDANGIDVLTLLAADGRYTTLDFQGRIHVEANLREQHAARKVTLCTDVDQRNRIVIACQTAQNIKILNPAGHLLFELPWKAEHTHVNYHYHTDPAKRVYTFTDRDRALTYVYCGKGRLLHHKPLTTTHPPTICRYTQKDGKTSIVAYTTYRDKCAQHEWVVK